ncbi:MAG: GGDEF domain-containing protein [Firmicutes bacterium]|nr:GGDEF domain-containing protein [Bacillota bacterium]
MDKKRDVKHALLVVFVLGIPLSMFYSGFAIASAQDQEPLIFLVNGKLTPIAYEQNGVAKGVVVDLAKALGEKIGHRIEIRAMDWGQAQAEVSAGQADALLQINKTPAREVLYSFSDPLLPSEFVIIRPQDAVEILGVADLEGKKVGVELGGYAYDLLSENDRIERVVILSAIQGLEFLKSKDLDALIVDRWIGEFALAQARGSGLTIVRKPVAVNYSRIAVKKGNDQLLELINQGLREINRDGTLDKIMNEWSGKNVIYLTEEHIIRIAVLTVMAILLIISSISVFFVVKLRRLNQALEVKVAERTQELAMVNRLLQAANAALKKQSMLDQLTQIPNRRGFDTLYQEAWEICQRAQQSLALIMIDIDRFKTINDVLGHLMGDHYLKELAFLLQNAAKRDDTEVARLGGDEFVCVMLNTTEDGAVQLAEEIQAQVNALTISTGGGQTRFAASFGVAALIPRPDLAATELISLADQALYKAKEGGRNKVVRASEV